MGRLCFQTIVSRCFSDWKKRQEWNERERRFLLFIVAVQKRGKTSRKQRDHSFAGIIRHIHPCNASVFGHGECYGKPSKKVHLHFAASLTSKNSSLVHTVDIEFPHAEVINGKWDLRASFRGSANTYQIKLDWVSCLDYTC